LATVSESHAQDLHCRRSRAIEAHIVGSRADHLHRLADCLRCKPSTQRAKQLDNGIADTLVLVRADQSSTPLDSAKITLREKV